MMMTDDSDADYGQDDAAGHEEEEKGEDEDEDEDEDEEERRRRSCFVHG